MNALFSVMPDLDSYDTIIAAMSGRKTPSRLCLLLDAGVDPIRIELWHHDVDRDGGTFMDWPSTLPNACAFVWK